MGVSTDGSICYGYGLVRKILNFLGVQKNFIMI